MNIYDGQVNPSTPAKSEPQVHYSALLPALVTEYLASDGSCGLYDAVYVYCVREMLVEIIGIEKIKAKQEMLRRHPGV